MPPSLSSQTTQIIGVDVGGTFTDLVAYDGHTLRVVKIPSTPGQFHQAVIDAVSAVSPASNSKIIHGSTVATNALLQRAGERIALITTEGFADILLIARQNRPKLYALNIQRPTLITTDCFGVPERIDAVGAIVRPLDEPAVQKVIAEIIGRGIKHVAICLLFSFVNPQHEQRISDLCRQANLTTSLSSDLLPEFREYERASTTAINASLRPIVEQYLTALASTLNSSFSIHHSALSIMHSSGGTLSPTEASMQAARLVLSGPAGGILGAAYVARASGFEDVITYDMGGTSTDVATILAGQPQWTTSTTIDGLPVALPMFDIHTVGAGGGSIAQVDAGGALRVGPQSAGAQPGPACYARGGTQPTVTDANLFLGRILSDQFLGGAMQIRTDLAASAIGELARQLGKSPLQTALGILHIAEANMAAAIRAVTSRRGHDPRQFTLVSFGGAGGLHACAIAASLDIPRVLIPPYAGVLSALGMVVAAPVAESSKTVVHLGEDLDDARLAAEYGQISGRTMDTIPYEQTATVEAWADVRFKGQSHELKIRVHRPAWEDINATFQQAYESLFGRAPANRKIEIVTLRVRRIGKAAPVELPHLIRSGTCGPPVNPNHGRAAHATLTLDDATQIQAPSLTRLDLLNAGPTLGPFLLIDREATAYIPPNWTATAQQNGSIIATCNT
jgi:N-methylhydantoinase A